MMFLLNVIFKIALCITAPAYEQGRIVPYWYVRLLLVLYLILPFILSLHPDMLACRVSRRYLFISSIILLAILPSLLIFLTKLPLKTSCGVFAKSSSEFGFVLDR